MNRRLNTIIATSLAIIVIGVYTKALSNGFVFDDRQYLHLNPEVLEGLRVGPIMWAFKAMFAANWHPLTWISHLADMSLYGLKPAGHHLTSILLHAANVVLLFLVLVRMTGSPWKSGFVAALFGLHPLRVESVAWVAERKDVLSALFFLLTMLAYVRYVERPGIGRYLLVALSFALGLMAKPMLVTVPFLLLLLDCWPLKRNAECGMRNAESRSLVIEKLPLLLLAVGSSVVTVIAQHAGGAVPTLERFSIGSRIANAALCYVAYIGKMLWPRGLAVFYMHSTTPLLSWQFAAAMALLVGISAIVFVASRRRLYLGVGWLWYLGSLVPVIGLVQVGGQGIADRYTYIPLIGLFIIIAWGVPEVVNGGIGERGKGRKEERENRGSPVPPFSLSPILPVSAAVILAALTSFTWIQISYWKNEVTLFSHAVAVTRQNVLAHHNLGLALVRRGDVLEGIGHYERALELSPHYVTARVNMGVALVGLGRLDEARKHYLLALEMEPKRAETHNNLGVVFARTGEMKRAAEEFKEAIRLDPQYAPARRNLRRAEDALRRQAAGHVTPGQSRRDADAQEHFNRGVALGGKQQLDQEIAEYRQAVRLEPNHSRAWHNLGVALSEQGKFDEAITCYRNALRIEPDYAIGHGNLAAAMYLRGDYDEARREVELCRRYGGTPNPQLVQMLSQKKPS